MPKFVVAQLLTVDEGGERTLQEYREAVRNELAQRGGVRRYIEGLKKKSFVTIRSDALDAAASKSATATPPPSER